MINDEENVPPVHSTLSELSGAKNVLNGQMDKED